MRSKVSLSYQRIPAPQFSTEAFCPILGASGSLSFSSNCCWGFNLPNDVLPTAFENPGQPLHYFDGYVDLTMLDFVNVAFTQFGEISQLRLG